MHLDLDDALGRWAWWHWLQIDVGPGLLHEGTDNRTTLARSGSEWQLGSWPGRYHACGCSVKGMMLRAMRYLADQSAAVNDGHEEGQRHINGPDDSRSCSCAVGIGIDTLLAASSWGAPASGPTHSKQWGGPGSDRGARVRFWATKPCKSPPWLSSALTQAWLA